MRRKGTRLLAAGLTGAALLSLTTAPAQAADPREATASPYAFIGTGDQEAVTIENQWWSVPEHISGRTPAHQGWSIHLSDEKLGAGLPRQDFRVRTGQTEPQIYANAQGFISIIDQNTADVPFLVVKLPARSVSCGDFVEVPVNRPRVFLRKRDGELHEATDPWQAENAEGVTSADSATDSTSYDVSAEVRPVTSAAQLTPYTPFAKYTGRRVVRASGFEIVLTQKDRSTSTSTTYRLLAGAVAASC
ncbi:hypothetical protein ABZX92_09680 [Lentzea sp. NPDC006480]|uniref:hypothetical protein n=1 Tax=Lentzea sp. NPDC006480 TaxID=3157176 RepID=UPI0033A4C621